VVAVEHDNDARGGAEKEVLWLRKMDAEKSDGGNIDLLESHDAPRALGQDQSRDGELRADAVEVEQKLVTGEL